MLSSASWAVALLLAAQSHAGSPAHGGHGGPPQAYRHKTPAWHHTYTNSTTTCSPIAVGPSSVLPALTTPGLNYNQATIYAHNATLKWWWRDRASQPASTVSIQFNTDDTSTGWTIFPADATDTVNLNYAVTTEVCSAPTTTLTYTDLTFTPSNCDVRFPQVAASTSGVYVNAFKTPNATTGYMTPIPDLRTESPQAYATVGSTTFSSGVPFVQFSQYEVVKCKASGKCRTSTFKLRTPYAFSYTGPNPANATNIKAIVTGKLDPAFPAYINRTALAVGEWSAPPTVIVVVNITIVAVAVLAATIEESASILIVPTPILPPGYSRVPPVAATTMPGNKPTFEATARLEQTQRYLLVPDSAAPQISTTTTVAKQGAVNTIVATTTKCQSNCEAPAQDIVVGSITLTPTSLPVYIANGKTIYIGQGASISDCSMTAPEAGTLLYICTAHTSTMIVPASGTFSADGMAIIATSSAGYYAPGHTIVAGAPGKTIGGLPVSLATGDGGLRIGETIQTAAATTTTSTNEGSTTTSDTSAATTSSNSTSDGSILSTGLALSACVILSWLWVAG